MRPLGKEATSGLPGPTGQRWGAAGQCGRHVANHPLELEAGKGSHLQAMGLTDSHLPEGGREGANGQGHLFLAPGLHQAQLSLGRSFWKQHPGPFTSSDGDF